MKAQQGHVLQNIIFQEICNANEKVNEKVSNVTTVKNDSPRSIFIAQITTLRNS